MMNMSYQVILALLSKLDNAIDRKKCMNALFDEYPYPVMLPYDTKPPKKQILIQA
jgi:hypothetical protein